MNVGMLVGSLKTSVSGFLIVAPLVDDDMGYVSVVFPLALLVSCEDVEGFEW